MTHYVADIKAVFLPMLAGVIGAAATPGMISTDEIVGWVIRAVLGGLIAIGAWILRDAAKTLKETHADMAAVKASVAAHQIMFEHWLDGLVEGQELPNEMNPGRRKSDEVLRALIEQRKPTPSQRRK